MFKIVIGNTKSRKNGAYGFISFNDNGKKRKRGTFLFSLNKQVG